MSESPRKLTFVERAVVRMFVSLMGRVLGEKQDDVVAKEFVRYMGLRGFFQYMQYVGKFVEVMEPVFGEINTQTLIGVSSLMAGCGYCGYGHTLAGSLLLYKNTEQLHPIHPHAIEELFDLEDSKVIERLDQLLVEPGFEDLRRQVNRMYRIYIGELKPANEEDELLKGILDFWRWTIECTIIEGIRIIPEATMSPHPIGGNKELRRRYYEARAAERAVVRTSAS